jgi:hypothetical protein
MHMILGLNLMRLLAQNRIAEFHTELELIDARLIHEDVFIRHAVALEQSLMEGSYNKVVANRGTVPAPEFLFFVDILIDTIRYVTVSESARLVDSPPSLPRSQPGDREVRGEGLRVAADGERGQAALLHGAGQAARVRRLGERILSLSQADTPPPSSHPRRPSVRRRGAGR